MAGRWRRTDCEKGGSGQIEPLGREFDLFSAVHELATPACVVGRDGRFRWLNSAGIELLGDQRGQSFVTVVAPEHRNLVRTNFARKLVGATGTVYDVVVLDRTGQHVALRVSSVALRDNRSIIGVFGIGVPLGRPSPTNQRPPELTPRQLETLRLLGEGLETAQIAERLGVADETARNHIRAVLRALGAHSRLEAVVVGMRLGLLEPAN